MNDLVDRAALNNIRQSEAVLQALGSRGTFAREFWSNDHALPIPYANGATIGGIEHAGRQLDAIERFTTSRGDALPTFIMDSQAALDLAPLGYSVRIADEWFVRDTPIDAYPDARVITISTPAELATFEAASVLGFGDSPPPESGHTYHPSLVDDDRLQFFALQIDGAIAAGVVLFHDPGCSGVYTFFTVPQHRGRGIGTAVLRHALGCARSLPLATNPSSMSRGIFGRLGFEPAGRRRVWVRPASITD